jgi:hypothetical protein
MAAGGRSAPRAAARRTGTPDPSSIPSIIITASRTSSSCRLISATRFSRVRATNSRLTAYFEAERASASTSAPTGSRVRWKRRVETPASICSSTSRASGSRSAKCRRLQRHLGLPVRGAHPRALHRDAAAAERHLTRLVAVAHRGALRIVLALRAHDLGHLLLHQRGHDVEPDAHRQRQRPLLRCPDQLAQRRLDARGQPRRRGRDLGGRYGCSFTAVPPSILGQIAAHAPKRGGRGRRDRRQVLRATGQPPATRQQVGWALAAWAA